MPIYESRERDSLDIAYTAIQELNGVQKGAVQVMNKLMYRKKMACTDREISQLMLFSEKLQQASAMIRAVVDDAVITARKR